MNVLDVKNVVNQIVLMLETTIEDCGQDGDFAMADGLQEDLDMFLKASEELNGLMNTAIHPFYLPNILKEHVPSLNLELFSQNLQNLTNRKKHTVERLTEEINSYTNMLSVFSPSPNIDVKK